MMYSPLGPSAFRELVSGRQSGMTAALARAGLGLIEIPYRAAVQWRNHRFDTRAASIHRVDVPIVSVGNLTLGGTGKTPMVQWLVEWFQRKNIPAGIVSRGYGAAQNVPNDEALELAARLPDIPHVQNPDRVAGVRKLLEQSGCRVVILDDAFQHRRLARDLDLVLLDALEPFGYGHVFPRGTLREPVAGLARAQLVALSRADLIDESERAKIRQEVRRLAPEAVWAELVHAPRLLWNAQGRQEPLRSLVGQPVAALCGIGNPAGFRHTLQMSGYRVNAFREFADHYRYTRSDLDALSAWADGLDVAAVLCTHKDLVKLQVDRLGSRPLWAVSIGLEFLAGQEALENQLRILHRSRL